MMQSPQDHFNEVPLYIYSLQRANQWLTLLMSIDTATNVMVGPWRISSLNHHMIDYAIV